MQKSLGDIKTLRSIKTPQRVRTTESVYSQLQGLSNEKHRLEKEAEFWDRKSRQIRKRLEEIGHQMETLQKVAQSASESSTKNKPPSSLKKWKKMTFNY